MKRIILFVAVLSLALLGFTTAQAQKTRAQEKQAVALRTEITAVHAQLAQSCGEGNAAGIARLFADDAQILQADNQAARGKGGVEAFFQSAFRYGVRQVKLNLEEVGGEGNLAYETGTIALYDEKGQVLKEGRYMILFKKIKNEWKIYRLLSNNKTAKPS